MAKKSLLIITNYFYPTNHIAAFRLQAFVKYLDRNLVDVSLITPWNFSNGAFRENDTYLGASIYYVDAKPKVLDLNIHKPKNRIHYYFLVLKNKINYNLFLDENSDFTAKATKLAENLITQKNINYLLTSYGPVSSILCGLKLKHKFPQVIWFSDLRDSINQTISSAAFLKNKLRAVESDMLKNANYITSVSRPILDDLNQKSSKPHFIEIANGFDHPVIKNNLLQLEDELTIIYAGAFYGKRNPISFFKAMELYASQQNNTKIKLIIYGGSEKTFVPNNLQDCVIFKKRVSQTEIIGAMQAAHAFLLISPTDGSKGVYTGKVFDYISIDRPIIALVDPTDVAAQLVNETASGYVCDNDDVEGIVILLKKLVDDYRGNSLPIRNWEIIENFKREKQVQKINAVISEQNEHA